MSNPTAKALFVTGTDTGVGKTIVAAALLSVLGRRGLKVIGMKPVASGCARTAEGLRNDDARLLMEHSTVRAPYELINPYAFEPAIAPHIAAMEAQISIELATLQNAFSRLASCTDVVVVEGAGGWFTPLDHQASLADFAASIDAKVVLVVGLRLGCLNHALLTSQAIKASGLQLAGWIANTVDPRMERQDRNIQSLEERLPAPLLGVIPNDAGLRPAQVADFLSIPAAGLFV